MVVRAVPYDGYSVLQSDSEIFGVMDQVLAAARNEKVATSRIRIFLSRALTWAEKEDLETDFSDSHLRRLSAKGAVDGFRLWVSPDRNHVWAEAEVGSRVLFDSVADILANEYVNIFPRAVRTFREYNGS